MYGRTEIAMLVLEQGLWDRDIIILILIIIIIVIV